MATRRDSELLILILCGLLAAHVTLTAPVVEEAEDRGDGDTALEDVEEEEEWQEEDALQPQLFPPDTPRFVVNLSDGHLLCFSIEGFELFTYNIITSPNLVVNAFMNVSQYDDGSWMRGHTDLGFIIKVMDNRVKSGVRLFKASVDSRKHRAIMGGFGEVDMYNGAITFTVEGAHSDIESQESRNEMFRVVMDQPVVDLRAISHDGKFFDFYVYDCSGLCEAETHGLIGQFLSTDVHIDPENLSLVIPGREPVHLEQKAVWDSIQEPGVKGEQCWYPAEGENVLEGLPYDYVVEHILATSYKFSKFKKT